MTEDELNEWGIEFIETLDQLFIGDQNYQDGDVEYIMHAVDDKYPDLHPDQMEWLEEFFSEV